MDCSGLIGSRVSNFGPAHRAGPHRGLSFKLYYRYTNTSHIPSVGKARLLLIRAVISTSTYLQ